MNFTDDRKAQRRTGRASFPTRRNRIAITAASSAGRATWSANNGSLASIAFSSEVQPFNQPIPEIISRYGNTLRSVMLQCVLIHRAIVRCWIKRLRRWKFGAGQDSTVVTRNCFNSKSLIRSRPFSFTTNPGDIRICASATSNPESSSSFKFRHSINGAGRRLSLWRHTPSKSLTNKQVRSQ